MSDSGHIKISKTLTLRSYKLTSSQDGDVGRLINEVSLINMLPPHATERRTTTNYKTKNNQNCQKI